MKDIMDLRHQSRFMCIIMLGGEDQPLSQSTSNKKLKKLFIPATIPADGDSPNTFKTLCQSIVVPKWTYLAFIWGNREKFRNSQLWAEIVNLSTCSTYNPKKELLELIGNNVPIDIQIATHGAKFAIKVSQQNQDDRVYCFFNNSNSPIIKKLIADSRRFGSPLY